MVKVYLNKKLVVENLKIANKKLISKLFVQNSSGDERRNEEKKNLIEFAIKLDKDDWLYERSVTTRDQRRSFKL